MVDGVHEVVSRPAATPERTPAGEVAISPRIESGTEMAFAGQSACACGRFPLPRHWQGVRLDDLPLSLTSAASTAVHFTVPADAAPGVHIVGGTPAAGFGTEDRWRLTVLRLSGTLDSERLASGGSTRMTLKIEGSDQPLDVRLENRTPSVISLEGGADQVARSSGGSPNRIERTVTGVGPGSFDIQWTLNAQSCPCTSDDLLERQLTVCKVAVRRPGQLSGLTDCKRIQCEYGHACTCEELRLAANEVCWIAPTFFDAMR